MTFYDQLKIRALMKQDAPGLEFMGDVYATNQGYKWYRVLFSGNFWWARLDSKSSDGVTVQETLAEVIWYDEEIA